MITDNSDWLLFLSLEKDLIATFDYVAVEEEKHDGVFSIAYLKILLAAGSAVERLAKKHGGLPLDDTWVKAKEIAKRIVEKERELKEQNKNTTFLWELECYIPRFSRLKPFFPWRGLPDIEVPPWWKAYDAAKHSGEIFHNATLKNVLECLAGLFCLNLVYYGSEVQDFPLPALYDHPTAIPQTMVTTVSSPSGK